MTVIPYINPTSGDADEERGDFDNPHVQFLDSVKVMECTGPEFGRGSRLACIYTWLTSSSCILLTEARYMEDKLEPFDFIVWALREREGTFWHRRGDSRSLLTVLF